jgi:hypothetical protein
LFNRWSSHNGSGKSKRCPGSYFLGQEQITRAADLQQKVKYVKTGNELMITVRTSLEVPREPVPAYFQGVNKSYKQLEKFLGTDKLDPNLEKLLT